MSLLMCKNVLGTLDTSQQRLYPDLSWSSRRQKHFFLSSHKYFYYFNVYVLEVADRHGKEGL